MSRRSTSAEDPDPEGVKPEHHEWYEFIRSSEAVNPLLRRRKHRSGASPDETAASDGEPAGASANAEWPSESASELEARLLAALRPEIQAGSESIREQFGQLRNHIASALTGALTDLANQQVAFQQQLIDRQNEILEKLVSLSVADGSTTAEPDAFQQQLIDRQGEVLGQLIVPFMADRKAENDEIRAEMSALRHELISFVGDEVAKLVAERQGFEQRLIDRQSEVLAKLVNPLTAERSTQSKQIRAETRALRDQLTGFIGEQFAKLAKEHERLSVEQAATRPEALTPAELEAALEQIRQETQQLRDEITTSVTDPIIDRIGTVAEEDANFRARLIAVARVVETRFDAFEARVHARLDQAVTPTKPAPGATVKKAPRAGAKKPPPRAAPRPAPARRLS
jgi:hypothetical protein